MRYETGTQWISFHPFRAFFSFPRLCCRQATPRQQCLTVECGLAPCDWNMQGHPWMAACVTPLCTFSKLMAPSQMCERPCQPSRGCSQGLCGGNSRGSFPLYTQDAQVPKSIMTLVSAHRSILFHWFLRQFRSDLFGPRESGGDCESWCASVCLFWVLMSVFENENELFFRERLHTLTDRFSWDNKYFFVCWFIKCNWVCLKILNVYMPTNWYHISTSVDQRARFYILSPKSVMVQVIFFALTISSRSFIWFSFFLFSRHTCANAWLFRFWATMS